MLTPQERNDLIAAAKLYYEESLTQAEVAARLGVSRPTVSKMLTRARETGIVHIEVRTAEEGNAELLKNLQQRYHLQGGLVLRKEDGIWQQAARYLALELPYAHHVGLGWGYAIGEVVNELCRLGGRHEGVVYPLIGKAHIPNKGYHPDELVRLWSASCGRQLCVMNCPAFPDSEEERESYEAGAAYKAIYRLWQQTDAAVLGIKGYPGVPDEATATRFGDALQRQKAVGSFLSYYYNSRGEFISGNNDFCMHVPLSMLRHCSKVIGILADDNVKAAEGALKTGIITHIILTEKTAQQLL